MKYIVNLQNGNLDTSKMFHNAHAAINDRYPLLSRKEMRKVWKDVYNVTIHYELRFQEDLDNNDGIWTDIEFESEDDFVLFKLMWG
jgi:hypothetical protein